MGRFLIYFSYFGTRYHGVQKQAGVFVKGKPLKTVSEALEQALKRLHPSNDIKITLSSRTDKGVHALKNACHVNLEYPSGGKEYNPLVVTNIMNNYFKEQEEDIRILQTRQVPETFNARFHARHRHYVYRLGHMLQEDTPNGVHNLCLNNETFVKEMISIASKKSLRPKLLLGEPLSTLDACKAVIYRTKLDITKLISAAETLSGIHNYSSFTSKSNTEGGIQPHPVKMLAIGVKRGQPLGHQLQKHGLDVAQGIEFWDIHVQSRSFLYKQIRKLVGSMVLVAKNDLSLDGLRDILINPKRDFPLATRMLANESGLFLLNVDYNPKDLEFEPMDSLSEQPCVQRSSHDADIVSSTIIHNQDERINEPKFLSETEETGSDISSEDDDDDRPAVPSDEIISADLKLAMSSKEITDRS